MIIGYFTFKKCSWLKCILYELKNVFFEYKIDIASNLAQLYMIK